MMLFAHADEQVCSVCETLQPCVSIVNESNQTVVGNLCRDDLARSLEALTGFAVVNMIRNMTATSQLARHPFTRRVQLVTKEGLGIPDLRPSEEGSGPARTRRRRVSR